MFGPKHARIFDMSLSDLWINRILEQELLDFSTSDLCGRSKGNGHTKTELPASRRWREKNGAQRKGRKEKLF